MNTDPITITTVFKGGRERYSLTSDALKIELISPRGAITASSTFRLSQLSEHFSVELRGTYLRKSILFAALLPLPVVIILSEIFPLMRTDETCLSMIVVTWFLGWVVFGSRRDICFHIRISNCRETLELVGQTRKQEELRNFVHRVIERIKTLNSDPDSN